MIKLVVITALMPEAVALIDHYRLQKVKGMRGFHLFRSDTMHVVVAGMGAARMTSGLRAYFAAYPDANVTPNWLNLGIAGTRDIEIGALCWAETITGIPIGGVGGPAETAEAPRLNVKSLASPGQDYQADTLFDMEAEACLNWLEQNVVDFSPAQFFCAKVVSDNQHDDSLEIDREKLISMFRALLHRPKKASTRFLNESTPSPCEPTQSLCEPTQSLCEPTQSLCEPTQSLCEPAQSLCEPAQSLSESAQSLSEFIEYLLKS